MLVGDCDHVCEKCGYNVFSVKLGVWVCDLFKDEKAVIKQLL